MYDFHVIIIIDTPSAIWSDYPLIVANHQRADMLKIHLGEILDITFTLQPHIVYTNVAPPPSSSRMCVMNHNWSATKQRLHLQNV